jgi:hypothetical protein
MSTSQTAIPDTLTDTRNSAWQRRVVEACLDNGFLPDSPTLVSFLVNAMYLIGEHGIKAYGGAPEEAAAELTRLGHGVAAGAWGRENRAGAGGPGRPEGRRTANAPQGRHDRAILLARAFGRPEDGGSDADFAGRLRAVRRDVRPGGLICFHVFDRDRVWSLTGDRTVELDGGKARVRVGFDPVTGLISARLKDDPLPEGSATAGGRSSAVKAWNLAEIRMLLRSAGLELERAYGDWDGRSPEAAGADTGRLIIVAAKPRRKRRKVNLPVDPRARRRPGSSERYASGLPA